MGAAALKCPHCGNRLVSATADAKIKIRTPIVVFSVNGAEIVCPRCKGDVPIDLQIGPSLQRALDAQPRLLVDMRRKIVNP